MAATGSAWALGLSTPRAPCLYSGHRDEGPTITLAAAKQHYSFSRSKLKKIYTKLQHKERPPSRFYGENSRQPSTRSINRYTQAIISAALPEGGVTTNGALHAKSNQDDNCESPQIKMRTSLEYDETNINLVRILHEAAWKYHSAMERQGSLTKGPWFAKAWRGIDQNAWMKFIGYQAAVHALLQANLVLLREGKMQDPSNIVQQSLLRLSKPLEDSIRSQFSSRDAAAEDWLWHQQHPTIVTSFLSLLENDLLLSAIHLVDRQSVSQIKRRGTDVTGIALALTIYASLLKLGPVKLSCSSFSSVLEDELDWLMNSLADLTSINCAYIFASSIGLEKEFLSKLSPRAASNISMLEIAEEERVFWIELLQQLVIRALGREGFCSSLPGNMALEVVEQDLAVFGFFAAFGRRARVFLHGEKIDVIGDSVSNLFRYLEGGFVLFYRHFATLTAYQLFLEVVNEELAWLPFFKEDSDIYNIGNKPDCANTKAEEAKGLFYALDSCSYWAKEFMKYSKWVQQAEDAHAVKFLSKIQYYVDSCLSAYNRARQIDQAEMVIISSISFEVGGKQQRFFPRNVQATTEKGGGILKSSNHGDDLESELNDGTWLQEQSNILDEADETVQAPAAALPSDAVPVSDDIRQRTGLPHPLFQMDTQLCEYTVQTAILKENGANGIGNLSKDVRTNAERRHPGDLVTKSFKKLKKASTDILKGTQLLAIDVTSAVALLRKRLSGYELTHRERKYLMRTMTDLAAIIPIGILMLLPVTAVGHAAILAAIQKYIPGLIPSAYAPKRLELLTQLEELRKLDMEAVGLNLECTHSYIDSGETHRSTFGQEKD